PTHEPPSEAPTAGADEGVRGQRDVGEAAAGLAASDKTEREQYATGMQAAVESPDRRATPAVGTSPERAAGGRVEEPAAPPPNGRIKAWPLARRLAEEAGLELTSIQGTGPGGRITKRDIEAALAEGPPAVEAPTAPAIPVAAEEVEEVPHTQMRKTIARRL